MSFMYDKSKKQCYNHCNNLNHLDKYLKHILFGIISNVSIINIEDYSARRNEWRRRK